GGRDTIFRVDDICSKISLTSCTIISELSADLKDLLRDCDLPHAVMDLLARSELVHQGIASVVFRVDRLLTQLRSLSKLSDLYSVASKGRDIRMQDDSFASIRSLS
ncbi:Uncharacterized protein TCAP_06903, partial [Tolypocladium capitatum]